MTKAARQPASTRTQTTPQNDPFRAFDALVNTAGVDSLTAPLAQEGADSATLNAALTEALRLAHDRWGLGLLHLQHDAQVAGAGAERDILLLVDGREVARLSQGAARISAAYETLRAQNADDLSEWGVLPEGHRTTLKNPAQLRVLIEDARDFETLWTAERSASFTRSWRAGDTLGVEVHRPASPATALADAAWDAIMSIKDRGMQRELMERSNSVGMLGALLGARHKDAARVLEGLPEAYFTVRSSVVRARGADARDTERHKAMLKEAGDQLGDLQKTTTQAVAALLKLGLR